MAKRTQNDLGKQPVSLKMLAEYLGLDDPRVERVLQLPPEN